MVAPSTATSIRAVVVSHRPGIHLERCLASLEDEGLRSVVVDNGSGGAVARVAQAHPGAELFTFERNRGFAAGANAGMARARVDPAVRWLLLLNDDAWLDPGCVAAVLPALRDAPPNRSMFALLRLRAEHPERIDSAGLELLPGGGCRDWLHDEPLSAVGTTPREIFGPSGGAALYRRELIEEVGDFEESFFAYFEDVDLAWRARARGHRAWLLPAARVMHLGGATALRRPWRRQVWLERNRLRCALRHLPAAEVLRGMLRRPLSTLRAAKRRPWIVLAHGEGWFRGLGRMPADLRWRAKLRRG